MAMRIFRSVLFAGIVAAALAWAVQARQDVKAPHRKAGSYRGRRPKAIKKSPSRHGKRARKLTAR